MWSLPSPFCAASLKGSPSMQWDCSIQERALLVGGGCLQDGDGQCTNIYNHSPLLTQREQGNGSESPSAAQTRGSELKGKNLRRQREKDEVNDFPFYHLLCLSGTAPSSLSSRALPTQDLNIPSNGSFYPLPVRDNTLASDSRKISWIFNLNFPQLHPISPGYSHFMALGFTLQILVHSYPVPPVISQPLNTYLAHLTSHHITESPQLLLPSSCQQKQTNSSLQ